jgi:hypothetical protein
MYRKGGIAGINKGVNAVAIRQCTNWGSRMGFARLAEQSIRKSKGLKDGEKLGAIDRIMASSIGGALGCWNQPIEVVRVEVSTFYLSVPFDSTDVIDLSNDRCNRWLNRLRPIAQQNLLSSTRSLIFTRKMVSKVFTVV